MFVLAPAVVGIADINLVEADVSFGMYKAVQASISNGLTAANAAKM